MSRQPADAKAAIALATEIHTLSGKLKRRLREQASAGDLSPSQTAGLGHLDRAGLKHLLREGFK